MVVMPCGPAKSSSTRPVASDDVAGHDSGRGSQHRWRRDQLGCEEKMLLSGRGRESINMKSFLNGKSDLFHVPEIATVP